MVTAPFFNGEVDNDDETEKGKIRSLLKGTQEQALKISDR